MIAGQSGTVTLLFSDLVNSTELLQQAGDEAAQRLFQAHHKLISDAVAGSGGEELEWLGDGVLAAFSSAADAVRCAINIEQTARRPVAGARFEIRIGLHLGEVLRREGGYFGMSVVTARRLCDRASSGQILCGKIIADLLVARQTLNFRELGQMALKGLAAPMHVCEVLYEHNEPAAMLNRTPFVGRAKQLQRLSARLEEACNAHGAVVMLRGEPGIGKTRTLEEFSDLARQRGAIVVTGVCYDGEWQAPYGPFAEAVVECSRRLQPAEFAAALGKRAQIIARIAPALNEILGDVPEPPPLDKEEERMRLFDAIAQLLIAISRRAPLVLILDDLHWADRGTVAMLSHVAHFVSASPILLIGAYRDAEVDRKHPLAVALLGISRQRNFEQLPLSGLAESDLTDLLCMIGDEEAPGALVKALERATEGNPLFIREVLLHLMEEGKLLQRGQGWTCRVGVEELGIPESVRQIVGRRLLKLSDNANRLLAVASAFNGEFSFDLAATVAELDEDSALGAIDEALDAQILRPGSNAESFDFKHAVIRHTVYSELNSARRVRLHRKIAEEMERVWGERAASHAAEVAFHFWRGAAASGAGRGANYALAAADNAEAAYAHDEVVAFLRIALELISVNDPKRPRLLARLGFALIWTLDGEEAVKAATEAASLIAAGEGNDPAAEYLEAAARSMLRGGLMSCSWKLAQAGLRYIGERRDIIWASLDEIDTYRADAENPDSPAITVDSPRLRERRRVLKNISSVEAKARRIDEYPYDSREEIVQDPHCDNLALVFLAGDCRRSLPLWQERAADAERSGRIALTMESWAFVARCHLALGELDAARAAYDRAVSFAGRFNRPSFQLLNVLAVRNDFLIAIDDGWAKIVGLPREAELLGNPPPEFKWAYAAACAGSAHALALQNRAEQALQLLAIVPDALLRGAPWGLLYSLTACDAASVLWLTERTDHVEVIESSLLAKVLVPDFRFPMRDARLSMARLCALQGRYEEATEWFAKARQVLAEMGARPLLAIADYDEGLVHLRRGADGGKSSAVPLLDAARTQFRRIGMTGWTRRAEQRLAGLASEVEKIPAQSKTA
jgi:class 3 adenylate cyclase/tetratricopeptide (TPR) repeat protein